MKKLKFLFPIDGDVLTPADGKLQTDSLYGERLFINVKVEAEDGIEIKINEIPAVPGETDNNRRIYSAAVPLDGYRTTLSAVTNTGDVSAIRVFRFKRAYMKYRLAIDDIVWSMMSLAKMADWTRSIFDVPFFALFQNINREFGSKVHMNIYFRNDDGSFNLTMMPDKYKEEFAENSDWLKLTFHARADKPSHIYKDAPYSELLHDYHQVNNEILRFAGPETMNTNVNGLHFAETTLEGARALRSVGVRCLVGYYTFDGMGNPSISYYLSHEQTAHAANRDFWVDTAEDIIFSKDKMVIDTYKLDDIIPRLDYIKQNLPHEAGTMNFVTHEQYYYPHYSGYQHDYGQKIRTAVKWAADNGYSPCFLSDIIGEDYPY